MSTGSRASSLRDELHPTGPLWVAAALASVAGYTDARLFIQVAPVFVANMSGNVVLFGIAVGGRDRENIAAAGVAIVAFVIGIGLATRIHRSFRDRGRRLRPDLIVAIEIVAFLVMIAFTVGYHDSPANATARALPILAAGGLAMGLQTAVIQKVGQIEVSTTYETGVVARLGAESVLPAEERERDGNVTHGRSRRVLFILGWLVITYGVGAVVATAAGASMVSLAIPLVILVIVGLVLRRSARGGH